MLLKGVGLLVHLPNPQALRRRRQDILPVALDIGYPHHLGRRKIMFELINLMKAVLWLPQIQIHDIDLILSVVNSKVTNVSGSGVAVISETPDIANARIEFENGCVANLTASRISLKNMRKTRFFQKEAYISVDFLTKQVEVVKMKDAPDQPGEYDMILQNAEGVKKQIYFEPPTIEESNAILEELNTFADAIQNHTDPIVTLSHATEALRVAHQIIACFK